MPAGHDEGVLRSEPRAQCVRLGTNRGGAFREAHEAVAQAVRFAESRNCELSELKLAELQRFSSSIAKDVYDALTLEGSLKSRNHLGGTAPVRVKAAIAKARKSLD